MLTIDGSMGEGGGQLLRTSLALSLLTSTPFRITKIRAGRARPGLMRQHLAAVNAAAEVGSAVVSGGEIGSQELSFEPKAIRGGDYRFAIGGAGSTTLVFQTVLFPLLLGTSTPSTIAFEGGTHNPMAPPFDFLAEAFLPVLARIGATVTTEFERHGFYPAGGGRWRASIEPAAALRPLSLLARGELVDRRALAIVANVPSSVAQRELGAVCSALGWDRTAGRPLVVNDSQGPGNVLSVTVRSEHVTEVFTGHGERGVRAEDIAANVAKDVLHYLAANVPVGEYLADQLLLPLALGPGGTFRTLTPSGHFRTQVDLLRLFLDAEVRTTEDADHSWRVDVRGRSVAS